MLYRSNQQLRHLRAVTRGLLILFFLQFSLAFASEEELASIELEVSVLNKELTLLEGERAVLVESAERIKKEAGKLRTEERDLVTKLAQLEEGHLASKEELRVLNGEIDTIVKISQARVRSLYKRRNDTIVESAVLLPATSSFSRVSFLLSKVRDYDQELIQRRKKLRSIREEKELRARLLFEEKKLETGRLKQNRVVLEDRENTKRKLLASLVEKQEAIEENISSLKAQALRVENVMASLTSGSPELEDISSSKKIIDQGRFGGAAVSDPVVAFEGEGLYKQRGSLRLPVKGTVIRKFGNHRHKDFSDMVFSKGLEFRSREGSPVLAITKGVVKHVGRMPGFGTIVLLDHGERYYSLYGRLSDVSAEVGKIVEKGAQIANASPKDSKGRTFYFEIRSSGNPVNPQQFYSRKFVVE